MQLAFSFRIQWLEKNLVVGGMLLKDSPLKLYPWFPVSAALLLLNRAAGNNFSIYM
jgi:hypothetical protein